MVYVIWSTYLPNSKQVGEMLGKGFNTVVRLADYEKIKNFYSLSCGWEMTETTGAETGVYFLDFDNNENIKGALEIKSRTTEYFEIYSICTDPRIRNQKIASNLLKLAIGYSNRMGKKLWLAIEDEQGEGFKILAKMYIKLGFYNEVKYITKNLLGQNLGRGKIQLVRENQVVEYNYPYVSEMLKIVLKCVKYKSSPIIYKLDKTFDIHTVYKKYGSKPVEYGGLYNFTDLKDQKSGLPIRLISGIKEAVRGESHSVGFESGFSSFHTHPGKTMKTMKTIRSWPSSTDFSNLISEQAVNSHAFHTVLTREGSYLITLNPSVRAGIIKCNLVQGDNKTRLRALMATFYGFVVQIDVARRVDQIFTQLDGWKATENLAVAYQSLTKIVQAEPLGKTEQEIIDDYLNDKVGSEPIMITFENIEEALEHPIFLKDFANALDLGIYKDNDGEVLETLQEVVDFYTLIVENDWENFKNMTFIETLMEMVAFQWDASEEINMFSTKMLKSNPQLNTRYAQLMEQKPLIREWLDCANSNIDLFEDEKVFQVEFFPINTVPDIQVLLFE